MLGRADRGREETDDGPGYCRKEGACLCGEQGLGRACADSLAEAGVAVTICARTEADVKVAAAEIGDARGIR